MDDARHLVLERARLYDRAAPIFDQVGPQFFSRFGRRLIDLAHLPAEARVLDVGTGRGAVLLPAALEIATKRHVFGIDLSGPMLSETAAYLDRTGIENVSLAQMDGEELAFAPSSFDALVCGFAIFWLPDLDRALAEFWRVLRPGGTLALSISAGQDEHWKWYRDLLHAYDRIEPILDAGAPRNVNGKPHELQAAVASAHFVSVRVLIEAFDVVFASADEWWVSLWTHGSRAPLERISPGLLERFRTDALVQVHSMQQADGVHETWHVAFCLAQKPN